MSKKLNPMSLIRYCDCCGRSIKDNNFLKASAWWGKKDEQRQNRLGQPVYSTKLLDDVEGYKQIFVLDAFAPDSTMSTFILYKHQKTLYCRTVELVFLRRPFIVIKRVTNAIALNLFSSCNR
jgi:hypothetical protein